MVEEQVGGTVAVGERGVHRTRPEVAPQAGERARVGPGPTGGALQVLLPAHEHLHVALHQHGVGHHEARRPPVVRDLPEARVRLVGLVGLNGVVRAGPDDVGPGGAER